MKMKKWFGFLTLGLALVMLAACGQKSTQEIIKTELKNSYVGQSNDSSYESTYFIAGSDTLTFDKKENTITNNQGKKMYFSVLSKKNIPSETQGVIDSLKDELKNTDNFTIIISRHDKKPTKDQAEAAYQIALSDGGKSIRIIELRRGYSAEGTHYDFKGIAE